MASAVSPGGGITVPASSVSHVSLSVPHPRSLPTDLAEWLADAEEWTSTCLTGIDVLLRVSSRYADTAIPEALLHECKARLVSV